MSFWHQKWYFKQDVRTFSSNFYAAKADYYYFFLETWRGILQLQLSFQTKEYNIFLATGILTTP